MVTESVEGVEAVFGQAEVQLESGSGTSPVLPFIFSVLPRDPQFLRFLVSDFHDHTWQADFSVQELWDLRDDVGIGGEWEDFLAYLRAALLSKNVKLMLGGLANGYGSTTARLVAQKTKGTPRLSLPLIKLEGSDSDNARGSLSVGMFEALQKSSAALSSERAQVSGLRAALAVEQAKVERFQDQTDSSAISMSLSMRRKLNKTRSSQLPGAATISEQVNLPSMLFETQDIDVHFRGAAPTGMVEESKEVAIPKPPGTKSRVHVAPASRRAKRRGTAITEEADP